MYNNIDKKKRNLDEFGIAVEKDLKPPRYKHFNTGSKLGCALMTRIRVGRSYLNARSYSIGLAPENTGKCNDIFLSISSLNPLLSSYYFSIYHFM